MNAALHITPTVTHAAASGPRPIPRAEPGPSEPFPERITCGSPPAAAKLRSHEASARLDMERAAAQVEQNTDGDDLRQRSRADAAARTYRAAAREARAFARLAELHEAQQVPSQLLTVQTRRHVRTLLGFETYSQTVALALASALRWTLGLPMPRHTGFEVMREGFERLGLLAPVVLPLAIAQAINDGRATGQPSGDSLPARTASGAPARVVVEVVQAGATEPQPETAEAYAEQATERARVGWISRVTQFSEIDFAEAYERGLSLSRAVEAARDWIIGGVVFGPLPFAWGEPDGSCRPFWRDAAGRLRTGKPTDGEPPVEGQAPEPTDGGGGSAPTAPPSEPTVEDAPDPEAQAEPEAPADQVADGQHRRELARADKLDGQAETAERKADEQRNLYAGMNLTRRRAQHRAAGMQEAERLTIYATALQSVARAVRTGTCPAVLSRVTTRAHVERLVGVPSGQEAQLTTPSYPEDGPAPHEWQNDARDKRRRMFARMGIESAEQFERAVAALAALTGGHHDPEQEARAEAARIERMIESARLAGLRDYFRTPVDLVETVLASSGLYGTGRGVRVLEPSAGDGAILDAVRERYPEAEVVAVEPSRALCEILDAKGHSHHAESFERFETAEPFNLVLMNPPFGRGGAVAMDHIERAASMLRPGGRLVGFVPESVVYRSDRRHTAFREFVDDHGGHYIDVPSGAFDDTDVKTRIVTFEI